MRKRTVRNGLRLVTASLIMIILASFYHVQLSEVFSLSTVSEGRIYRSALFWAAAIGGYGVVQSVFGFIMSPRKNDIPVRLAPVVVCVCALICIFFYLLTSAFDTPDRENRRRLRPGETITI